MSCFGPLDLIKMSWNPQFLAENEQPLAVILKKQTDQQQIHIASPGLQKQLQENPFIHTQLPIVLMTLLMITFQ